MENNILKNIFNDEFLENLAKSADLYKTDTNSALSLEEFKTILKIVPRAVMSMLVAELVPMEMNSSKDIRLPFGRNGHVVVNKNAADDFTGSVYENEKIVYEFKHRSMPGLGLILLSTFGLYNMEDLSKPTSYGEDFDKKVQKLIDEKMEFHSLVGKVVEEKLAQREAIHKLMMLKLNEALAIPTPPTVPPIDVTPKDIVKKEGEKGVHAPLFTDAKVTSPGIKTGQGMSSMGYNVRNPRPDMIDPKIKASAVLEQQRKMPKPNLPKSEDIVKKEVSKGDFPVLTNIPKPVPPPVAAAGSMAFPKSEDMIKKEKGSPLKGFLERKKKPMEHKVEMMKSESVDCPDCGQTIFGSSGFAGCICFGQDQHRKIWIKKTEDGVQLRFSRGWDNDNIDQLLNTLRKTNGKH